jgi:hypothetical protein
MSPATSMVPDAATRQCHTAIISITWWRGTYTIRTATIATITGP